MSDDHASPRRLALALVVAAGFGLLAEGLGAQNWRTLTAVRQATGERSLDVEVRYTAGAFSVEPAGGGVLYRMELRYDQDTFDAVNEYRNGRVRLGIDGNGEGFDVVTGDPGSLTLTLARAVPMDLDMEFGAVKAELDLGGLALTDLKMATGASETRLDVSSPNTVSLGTARLHVGAAQFHATRLANLNAERIEVEAGVGDLRLDFTGEWQRDASVSVEMGVGSLELRFPIEIGVKLERDAFLTKIDAAGMVKQGDSYYSANWDEAARRVDVHVESGFGRIAVEWVR